MNQVHFPKINIKSVKFIHFISRNFLRLNLFKFSLLLLLLTCQTLINLILGLEGEFVSLLVAVRAFHASLLEMKLFKENEAKVLLDYVDNINETFVNQRCQSLLGQARIVQCWPVCSGCLEIMEKLVAFGFCYRFGPCSYLASRSSLALN